MLYFEDLKLGDQYTTPEQMVTAEDIIAFAKQYDPQPFHTDPLAAKTSLFGQLVASGWHTTAITMGLMVRGTMDLEGGVIGQGVDELRWPQPVVPGDRLRVVMEIAELNSEPSRTGRGKIKLLCRTYNQEGKVVQQMMARVLVSRRNR